ncbi:MAG: aminodeoxychorismate synthase component I, partial [Candidatus Baumannia cicadellinicola]|nr:aminodeoxychorismate synthase component I [Candidatus Baumannia cicadellinicola]
MIEPYLTNLPYQPDAVLNIFAPLSIQPWAILLHSSNTNHVDGNFDILVAKPIVTLVTNNGVTKICNGTDYLFSKTDPFILIQQELEKMQLIVQPNKYIPFQGGAVGLFSYDLVRYFETLPRIAQRDLNLPDMAVGIYRWALIADHARSTLTLVSYE